MHNHRWILTIALGAVAGLAVLAIGCSSSPAAPSGAVTFTLTGVELKGSTTTESLAAPSVDPTTLSAGYRYKAPGVADKDNPSKWEVATYIWTPGAMTVSEGEEVTLRLFAVNGDKHEAVLYAPDGSTLASNTYERGREGTLTFVANQAGRYRLLCITHQPTMEAVITALPK